MKKLFDSKFLIISALSIVTLILLIVFSFFLFDRNESKFVKSGYIINPLSATSEKYFFDEGTGYRENLSSMVVFNDVDSNEVKVLRDSFVHYEDGSISLLKNGAILDVDSIHNNLALFYNISNDSVIEKDNNGYHIESLNGNINLKNFIVRISDKKYLVAGDVKLSYSGSSSLISGDYFEIVYVEEGIVNIENKNFKYELSAEGTNVIVGDYTINLGTKVLSYRDNDIMSITAITIDGNENVEIIPKKEEEKSGNSASSENPSQNIPQDGSGDDAPGPSSSALDGSGEGGNGSSGGNTTRIDAPKISLKDAKIGSTNVEVVFDIESEEDNSYMLQVVNADTGNTIDITAQVLSDTPIDVNLLTPSTKYLFSVVNRETKEQYFQKMFKTDSFGISLDKAYAKDDSLTYKLVIGSDTQVSDATLTLYKFDEDLGERVETGKVIRLSEIPKEVGQEEYYLTFDGLSSDSIYTAVLDNFSLESVNFRDVYNLSVTSLTLKKTPIFPNESSEMMSVTEGETSNNFKLYIGNIKDEDNAITGYTYYVYDTKNTEEEDDDELALEPIVKDNASPITVSLGKENNELREDTNYYYKTVIEYFDNEKYIEYETIVSSNFIKTGKPTVTVIPNVDEITYNQIGAKIFINDKGCEIKLPGRTGVNCSADNIVKIYISRINKNTGERENVREMTVNFNIEGESVFYPLLIDDLESGTTYYINVYTVYSSDEEGELQRIPHASDSTKTITTKTLADFSMKWQNADSSIDHVIKIDTGLEGIVRENAMAIDDSVSKLSKIVFELYNGDVHDSFTISQPIATKVITGDIKSLFYDELYTITSDVTFGLSKSDLENMNVDGKVSKQYTIVAHAYYGSSNEISLENKVYLYNVPITIREDDISEPEITVDVIKNNQVNNFFEKVGTNTVVGYSVHGLFVNDNRIPVKNVVFKVYDRNNNPVKFYIKKGNGTIDISEPVNEIKYTDVDTIEANFEIFMDYGVDYGSEDDIMRRGNQYTLGYYLEVLDTETGNIVKYPNASSEEWPNSYGIYALVSPSKETPSMKMYTTSSTNNSVSYKYFITDADNSIYKTGNKYYLHYKINGGLENNVDLTLTSGDNKFRDEFTIDDLNPGDTYSLYYKLNTLNTGNISSDIEILNDSKINDLKFDGYVDSSMYEFKYKVINQPSDNRVAIVILSDDIMLNRTLDYKITFTDSKNHNYEVNTSKLFDCSEVYDISLDRCYFVDYAKLKSLGMKSDASQNEINNITVSVSASYNSGLMGFDADFDNYILREISRKDVDAKYIVLDLNGNIIEWSRAENLLAGYYSYTKKIDTDTGIIKTIDLKNKSTQVQNKNIGLVLKNYGYVRESDSSGEAILPYEVKIEDMPGEDNTFFFSSITPKAAPNVVIPFLSGAGMSLKVSGIDLTDFVKENNKYQLYIEVWENSADIGNLNKTARPRVEIPIDSNTTNLIENVVVTGLHSYNRNTHPAYYYQIYAMMYVNNQPTYVQLDDANSVNAVKKTYSFQTRGAANILKSDKVELNTIIPETDEDGVLSYGERYFTTTFNLERYTGGFDMDYNLEYYFCYNDGTDCDLDNYIIKREISKESMADSIVDTFNAYNDNLIYGTSYRMYTYAKFPVYERNEHDEFVLSSESLRLTETPQNGYIRNIRNLIEPTFTILREAKYINGQYAIDFKVNVNDPDKVLQTTNTANDASNGVYYIALTSGDSVVGTLQVMSSDEFVDLNVSGYEDYSKYPFRADVLNNQIRIIGSDLESETEYKMQAYGIAYTNNLNTDGEKVHNVYSRKYSAYTSNTSGVAFGSITYTATEKSIIATFLGGSSLVNNVNRLEYTIIDKTDDREYRSPSGGYVIGSGEDHFFEYTSSEEWMLTLKNDMNNINNHAYIIAMNLYDKDNNLYEIPDNTIIYYEDRNQ